MQCASKYEENHAFLTFAASSYEAQPLAQQRSRWGSGWHFLGSGK